MINNDIYIKDIQNYPEAILQNRELIEGNVIGCLFSELTFYDDCVLKSDDFITKDGNFLFGLGKLIREKGFSVIDEITIMSNVSTEILDRFNAIGGWESIADMIGAIDIKNWDGILDGLNKNNILLKLQDNGFELQKSITLNNGKVVVPIKLFEKFDSTQVIEFYESRLANMSVVTSNKIISDNYVDFDDSFLESLSSGEEIGVSFGDAGNDINGDLISTFPFMSNNILGLKSGTLSAFGGHSGTGKTTYMVGILMSLMSKGVKPLIVSNEMTEKQLKTMFLIWLINRYFKCYTITKRKLVSGALTDDERNVIKQAQEYWRQNYSKQLKIVCITDADSKLTCQIVKNHILRYGVDAFLVDTFKLDTSDGSDDNFWLSLINDSRELSSIALKYNVIGLMTIQLAENSRNRLWMDSNCLSQSKAVKEVLSNLILMRKVFPEEFIQGGEYDCKPFRSKQDMEGNWYEEQYIPDPSRVYRMMFIEKSRSGIDSGDSGVCYLIRYDGDRCTFYESCKARSVRKLINTSKS